MDFRDIYMLGKAIKLNPRYAGQFEDYTTDELRASVERINALLTAASVLSERDGVTVFDRTVTELVTAGRDCVRRELIRRLIP